MAAYHVHIFFFLIGYHVHILWCIDMLEGSLIVSVLYWLIILSVTGDNFQKGRSLGCRGKIPQLSTPGVYFSSLVPTIFRSETCTYFWEIFISVDAFISSFLKILLSRGHQNVVFHNFYNVGPLMTGNDFKNQFVAKKGFTSILNKGFQIKLQLSPLSSKFSFLCFFFLESTGSRGEVCSCWGARAIC